MKYDWEVTKYLSDKQNRLFAVWGVREALNRVHNPAQLSNYRRNKGIKMKAKGFITTIGVLK